MDGATVVRMDEARAVLERLARIDALEREGAAPHAVLAEVRSLLREAEAWARLDGDDRAHTALARVGEALTSPAAAA